MPIVQNTEVKNHRVPFSLADCALQGRKPKSPVASWKCLLQYSENSSPTGQPINLLIGKEAVSICKHSWTLGRSEQRCIGIFSRNKENIQEEKKTQ